MKDRKSSTKRRASSKPAKTKALAGPLSKSVHSVETDVASALAWLKGKSTPRDFDNLARFGITAKKAFGVSMKNIQVLGKRLGRSHKLANALWDTGWYEARMLTSFVDEPARVSSAQMDRWRRQFDNWAVCDTLCFHLFDRTPHAWVKVDEWSDKREEFGKRAAFALLASLALHDQAASDAKFLDSLKLVERAATDERNFVKKGVNWALRSIGRRNAVLRSAAVGVSRRLANSENPTARWVGKDALRDLMRQR